MAQPYKTKFWKKVDRILCCGVEISDNPMGDDARGAKKKFCYRNTLFTKNLIFDQKCNF